MARDRLRVGPMGWQLDWTLSSGVFVQQEDSKRDGIFTTAEIHLTAAPVENRPTVEPRTIGAP